MVKYLLSVLYSQYQWWSGKVHSSGHGGGESVVLQVLGPGNAYHKNPFAFKRLSKKCLMWKCIQKS
jgi:hypothetical protein